MTTARGRLSADDRCTIAELLALHTPLRIAVAGGLNAIRDPATRLSNWR
jgi:hypothetical protein